MGKLAKLNRFWILIWGIFFAVIAAILIVAISSERQTTVESGDREISIKSLTCTHEDYFYPFLSYDHALRKDFKIVATFDAEHFRTISLQQMLYYDSPEEISQSEGMNHVAMNVSFGENGLEADALGANFAKLNDGVKFGLYGEYGEMNSAEVQYFLLDGAGGYDYEHVLQTYEGLGMKCEGDNA